MVTELNRVKTEIDKNREMNRIKRLYKELFKKYGKPKGQWKLWCKRPKTLNLREEIIIGAVLTQRTNWNNVEKAIALLKKSRICSLNKIYKLGKKNKIKLAKLVKPCGFYRKKAGYLFNLTEFIKKSYGTVLTMKRVNLKSLRKELIKIKGLGPETVDSILLYALDKPIFVIDEYTKRLVKRYKLAQNLSYRFLQDLFEDNLIKNYRLFQDFHALIVIEEKTKNSSSKILKEKSKK